MKFAVIHAAKATLPVASRCRVLEAPRAGYNVVPRRTPIERRMIDVRLRPAVSEVFEQRRGRFG